MPPSDPRHDSFTANGGASSLKRKPRLLSLLLKAVVMTLITSIFFVFLGLAAILLLHLCLAGSLLHRRRGSSSNLYPGSSFHEPYHDHPQQHQSPLPGLSSSELRRVPKFRFLNYSMIWVALGKQREESTVVCAICLDEVKEGQWCRRLIECGHVFHKGCVDTWLVKVAACPVCRRGVSGLREGGGGGSGRDLKVDGFQDLLRL